VGQNSEAEAVQNEPFFIFNPIEVPEVVESFRGDSVWEVQPTLPHPPHGLFES
jgi:hypothetical protein